MSNTKIHNIVLTMQEKDDTLTTVPEEIIKKRIEKINSLKSANIECFLEGTRIIVWNPKHGYLLYEAAFFGKPLGIRKPKIHRYNVPYEISFYDALYLLDRGIIKIKKNNKNLSRKKLIAIASKVVDDFTAKYAVYEDLRDKGFIVKPGMKFGADFVVYIYGPGIDHSPFAVSVFSKKITLKGQDFLRSGRLSWSVRKKWVLACVYDSEIKYFVFEWDKDLSV